MGDQWTVLANIRKARVCVRERWCVREVREIPGNLLCRYSHGDGRREKWPMTTTTTVVYSPVHRRRAYTRHRLTQANKVNGQMAMTATVKPLSRCDRSVRLVQMSLFAVRTPRDSGRRRSIHSMSPLRSPVFRAAGTVL